jgi:hypothetical protein
MYRKSGFSQFYLQKSLENSTGFVLTGEEPTVLIQYYKKGRVTKKKTKGQTIT